MKVFIGLHLALIFSGILASALGTFFYSEMVKPYGVPKYPSRLSGFTIGVQGNETVIFYEVSLKLYTSVAQNSESNWKTCEIRMEIISPLPKFLFIQVPWKAEILSGPIENSSYFESSDITLIFIKPKNNILLVFSWDIMTRKSYDTYEINIDLLPDFLEDNLWIIEFNLEVIPPPSSILNIGETFPPPSHITKTVNGAVSYLWNFVGSEIVDRKDKGELLHLSFLFQDKKYVKENLIFLSGVLMGTGLSVAISSFLESVKRITEKSSSNRTYATTFRNVRGISRASQMSKM